jgi:hypothetical protein
VSHGVRPCGSGVASHRLEETVTGISQAGGQFPLQMHTLVPGCYLTTPSTL